MFVSRCLMVVYKTTGGKAWNPPGGLRPLSPAQRRNRRKNVGLTLKNMSVLKMAEAQQPRVLVRLYKPLDFARMMWMKKKLAEARDMLEGLAVRGGSGGGKGNGPGLVGAEPAGVLQTVRRLLPSLRAAAAARAEVGTGAGPSLLLPAAARAALSQDSGQQQR